MMRVKTCKCKVMYKDWFELEDPYESALLCRDCTALAKMTMRLAADKFIDEHCEFMPLVAGNIHATD